MLKKNPLFWVITVETKFLFKKRKQQQQKLAQYDISFQTWL